MDGARQEGSARVRLTSAGIAAAVSGTPALVLLLAIALPFDRVSDSDWIPRIGLAGFGLGAVLGALLAWRYADQALSVDQSPGPGFLVRTAGAGVLLGAVLVAAGFGLGVDVRVPLGATDGNSLASSLASGLSAIAAMSAIALVYGLVLFGLPAFLMALAVEWAWIRLLRRAVPARRARVDTATPGSPRVRLHVQGVEMPGWAAVGVAVVAAGAEVAERARSNDPPGILHAALVAWLLAFLAPALVAAAGLHWRSPMAVVAGASGLIELAAISTPIGTVAFAGAAAVLIIAAVVGQRKAQRRSWTAAGPLLLLLLLLAPFGLIATRETVCWDVYADFGLTMRIWAQEPNGPSEVPVLSTGCRDRSYSTWGAEIATYAAVGAVLVAVMGSRRHPIAGDDEGSSE